MNDLPLLQRFLASPFTGRLFWDERPHIGLAVGDDPRVLRDRGLFPAGDGEAVDAWIHCAPDDLAAMLALRPPVGAVSATLGDRPGSPRRKQARVLLALAALGWCGPWPDPAADREHVRLVRAALYDLGIGPEDGTAPLFPPDGPLPGLTVRLSEGAAGTELVTVGLADVPGRPELATLVPPRVDPRRGFPVLRAAAAFVAELGTLPRASRVGDRTLTAAPHPRFARGFPLPNQHTALLRVALT